MSANQTPDMQSAASHTSRGSENRRKFFRSLVVSFLAVQIAAFVFLCGAFEAWFEGLSGIYLTVCTWGFGQVFIFPMALGAAPFGALLLWGLHRVFGKPLPVWVTLLTGGLIGSCVGACVFARTFVGLANLDVGVWSVGFEDRLLYGVHGLISGLFTGLVWWRVEPKLLEKQNV